MGLEIQVAHFSFDIHGDDYLCLIHICSAGAISCTIIIQHIRISFVSSHVSVGLLEGGGWQIVGICDFRAFFFLLLI